MDLYLALFIFTLDVLIVTVTVTITHYKLKKAERDALKERDLIEQRFINEAKAMRESIEKRIDAIKIPDITPVIARIDAIEIPEPDLDAIKAELKESLSQSLNAHITGLKKELNDLKATIEKYAESHPSGGESPDPLGKLIMRYADKMF